MRVYHSGYYSSYEHIEKVKITKCDLKDLVITEEDDVSFTFFIKDEEDKYGNKLNSVDILEDIPQKLIDSWLNS